MAQLFGNRLSPSEKPSSVTEYCDSLKVLQAMNSGCDFFRPALGSGLYGFKNTVLFHLVI
jgi:hypothetical protein